VDDQPSRSPLRSLIGSGSMKWFMPPIRRRRSRTQADTHEPSTVEIISSWALT
jgi:hypothetical protein